MKKRIVIVMLVLGIATAGSWVIKLRAKKMVATGGGILSLPFSLGEYAGQNVALKDEVYAILGTRNVIMREYRRGEEPPILLYIIFDPETMKSSDPPENCIQGGGATITAKEKIMLAEDGQNREEPFTANKLVVLNGSSGQMFVYWFLAGGDMLDSYVQQRARLIRAYLLGRPLSGGQVRISTDMSVDNEEEALSRLREYIDELLPVLKPIVSN